MKIAISTQGQDLKAQVDPRFGRCTGFIIYDTETGDVEYVQNTGAASGSGAGIQAATMLIDREVKAVLTGNVGPNAHTTLTAAEIDIYTGMTGSVEDCVNRLKQGTLESANTPTVSAHHGVSAPAAAPTEKPSSNLRIAVAAEDDRGLESLVSAHFGRAPYYAVVEASGAEITSCRMVDNPFFTDHGSPGQVPSFVNDQGADVIIAGGMGGRAVGFFEQFSIEPVTGAVGTVGECVIKYLKGELKGTVSCKHTSC